ncbi:MAG TPA: site-2 protease family protein [Bryobacteraceae bacterium]|nr:site-2 protease family protein [Bryobacteraceae bacterium]
MSDQVLGGYPGAFLFLMLISIVSLSVAIFNMLPIPILDGGRIMIVVIEMLIGRDMSASVKQSLFRVGFLFVMVWAGFNVYTFIADMRDTTPSMLGIS